MSSAGNMLIALLIVIFCCHSNGEVYKVGGSSGWTNLDHPNYKLWAASKTFRVNDTIVFEYNNRFHNVVRVTHKNYNACNTTVPYATWSTGNDSFKIRNPGHFYFICGTSGHCQNGQRVDIRVIRSHTHAPAPSPLSPSGLSPKSPTSSGPSPSSGIVAASPSSPSGPSPMSHPSSGPSPSSDIVAPAPSPMKSGCNSLNFSWKALALLLFVFNAIIAY